MLIFWGCGAHAGPGQPVIIDFSKLAEGKPPPHLFATDIPAERGPDTSNSRTFGDWPNARSRQSLSAQSSLVGEHRVVGNYARYRVHIGAGFPRAIDREGADRGRRFDTSQLEYGACGNRILRLPVRSAGARGRRWRRRDVELSRAAGIGRRSVRLAFAGHGHATDRRACRDAAEPDELHGPRRGQTSAGQVMIFQLHVYGPEADFAYPPRPADRAKPWTPDWTAKVRYKSTTGLMLGVPAWPPCRTPPELSLMASSMSAWTSRSRNAANQKGWAALSAPRLPETAAEG